MSRGRAHSSIGMSGSNRAPKRFTDASTTVARSGSVWNERHAAEIAAEPSLERSSLGATGVQSVDMGSLRRRETPRFVASGNNPNPDDQPRRFQNGSVRPMEPSSDSVSSKVCRRQSDFTLFRYQPSASRHVCSSVRIAPRGRSRAAHHRSTCSSSRKSNIVLQVKPMLSHQ